MDQKEYKVRVITEVTIQLGDVPLDGKSTFSVAYSF